MNNKQNDLKKNILSKIDSGKIKMKPKIYFTAKTVIVLFAVIAAVVVLSFLVGFAVFSIRASSRLFLLGFGSAGIWTFLVTFPWLLLVTEIILLIFVDILLKYFKFAYKTPFIYLMAGTTVFVVLISFFTSTIPVHETLYQEAIEQKIPIFETIYKDAKRPPEENGVFRGVIISVDDDAFTIFSDDYDKDKDDGQQTISISKERLKYIPPIRIGDFAVVACKQEKDGRCYLYGLKKLKSAEMK